MEARRKSPRSVCLLSLGGLGDFISRWPLWQSLRRSFPQAKIAFFGYPRHGRLLAASGLCDVVKRFDDRRWISGEPIGRAFDLVVSLLGVRGREWLGGASASIMEIEPFPPAGSGISVRSHLLAEIEAKGLAGPGQPRLAIDAETCARIGRLWERRGLTGRRVVAIHPGSGSRAKNWPIERFVELSARLRERGFAVLFLSGEAEEEGRSKKIAGALSGEDIVGLAAVLGRCSRYIGNDSGVSHLAALAGVPAAVIFGPTDPVVWAPAGERVTVIRHPLDCAPCGLSEMGSCRRRRCLEEITVEEVLRCILYGGG